MITYSQEVLTHFQCDHCKGWWTIGDHKDTHPEKPMSCPHCGTQHFEYVSPDNASGLLAKINELKDQLFEAQQALLKEGMRANELQKRIDGGVKVSARIDPTAKFYDRVIADDGGVHERNAILILDEGVTL